MKGPSGSHRGVADQRVVILEPIEHWEEVRTLRAQIDNQNSDNEELVALKKAQYGHGCLQPLQQLANKSAVDQNTQRATSALASSKRHRTVSPDLRRIRCVLSEWVRRTQPVSTAGLRYSG